MSKLAGHENELHAQHQLVLPDLPAPELPAIPTAALRRCVLAVSVVHDLDLRPLDDGFAIMSVPEIVVTLTQCWQAIGDADPDGDEGRRRLTRWLQARQWVSERSLDDLAESVRPVALPVGHSLHPGADWVRKSIIGGSLDLGFGALGLDPANRDQVVVVPPGIFEAVNVDPAPWWPTAMEYLENMGALATVRWRQQPKAPLRPMGDCDVVTLLASIVFRGALCADSEGLRAAVVPMRTRGWLDPSHIDPAFAQTAAALTSADERGFSRPVLLTAEEVTIALANGRPAQIVLRDPATSTPPLQRNVLYH